MTSLPEYQEAAHANARNKGFYDVADRLKDLVRRLEPTDPELAQMILSDYYSNRMMLIVGELSEAHEQLRMGRAMNEEYVVNGKPEGIPSEFADVFIRLSDLSEEIKISLERVVGGKMNFNSGREKLHGKKF